MRHLQARNCRSKANKRVIFEIGILNWYGATLTAALNTTIYWVDWVLVRRKSSLAPTAIDF
jgi:hypothetical protein